MPRSPAPGVVVLTSGKPSQYECAYPIMTTMIDRWQRRAGRERRARELAKELLEKKSRELLRANERLERRVEERTTELATINDRLREEITTRRATESQLESVLGVVAGYNEELEDKSIEAHRANAAKSEFLANVSHELRTPLHSILSFSTFGVKEHQHADRESLAHYFEQISTNGQNLLELITDLLDLSRLESGNMEFRLDDTDLAFQVKVVGSEMESLFQQAQVELKCFMPMEMVVRLDDQRMCQVLRNILSNALRVSPAGGAIVVRLEARGDEIELRIEDQGPGFHPDEVDSVFEKFTQSRHSPSTHGTAGLGLALCREIVSGHGGTIGAENPESGGACIRITLPHLNPRGSR